MNANRLPLRTDNRMNRLTDPQYQASLQSDAELVDLYALGGQEQALLALMERYGSMVAAVIKRVVFHAQDAEDAFQATWLVFMKSARKIRRQRSVAAWLYGVAYRTACRVRAHSRRQSSLEDREVPDQHCSDEPIEQLVRQIDMGNLDRELQSLPQSLREPLFEFYILGLTAREIAQRTELSISAVEGRLRRGRQLLRQRLASRGASLSVCAAGIEWMQTQDGVTQLATTATESFTSSPLFNSPEKLGELDAYLNQIVTGESAMVTSSASKSYGFWATLGLATATLTIAAMASQLDSSSGSQSASSPPNAAQVVQPVEAGEPTTDKLEIAAGEGASAAAPTEDPFGTSDSSNPSNSQSDSKDSKSNPSRSSARDWWMNSRIEYEQAESIRDKLSQPIEVDFVNIPFSAMIQYFEDERGVDFVADEAAIDFPVTLQLASGSVRDVLDLVLEEHDLAYEVHPTYIRIVGIDLQRPSVRSYELHSFVKTPQQAKELVESLSIICKTLESGECVVLGSTLIVNGSEDQHREVERVLITVPGSPYEN